LRKFDFRAFIAELVSVYKSSYHYKYTKIFRPTLIVNKKEIPGWDSLTLENPFDFCVFIIYFHSIMNRPITIVSCITLHMLIAAGALAQSIPSHQMSFSIHATRTITSQTDTKDTTGTCGHSYNKDHSTISLTFSANSDKVTFSNYGNSAQSPNQALNSPATDSDVAFSGNGRITFTGSCDDGIDCGGCKSCCSGDATSEWNVSENINLTTNVSFEYDQGKKQGSFNLGCKFDAPEGNADGTLNPCDSQYLPSSNANLEKAAMKMLGDLYGQFAIQNYSTFGKLRMSQAMKDELQKALDGSGNGGIATISATASGYQLSYSNTVSSTGTPAGCTGTTTTTITTTVSVSIGGQPIEYDAILVPVGTTPSPGSGSNTIGTYEQWEPEGPFFKNGAPVGTEGNSVTFMVQLVEKGHQDQPLSNVPFKVDYKLTSSSEPGIATNYPPDGSGSTDPDLQFSTAMIDNENIETLTKTELASTDSEGANVAAIITSYDYGSYGTLTAKVTLANGGMTYDAHLKDSTSTTIPLPKDYNNNHIADYWEDTSGVLAKNYAQTWDGLHYDGNSHDGDGLTIYEKYRGFLIHGKYQRIDPKVKHIFFRNQTSNANLQSLFSLFQSATQASGGLIQVHVCDPQELDQSNVINIASSDGKGGNQYDIEAQDYSFTSADPTDVNTLAETFSKDAPPNANGDNFATNPKDVKFIGIKVISSSDDIATYQYVLAHELGHALGLHHHGDDQGVQYNSDVQGEITSKSNPAVIVNAAGSAIDSTVITHSPDKSKFMVAPYQHSTASGDMTCIMCYTSYYAIGRNETTARNIFTYVPLGSIPFPTTFCKSATGTGINAPSHTPVPAFGDAANGNCWGAITIKTW
jgi:hypothetical protein